MKRRALLLGLTLAPVTAFGAALTPKRTPVQRGKVSLVDADGEWRVYEFGQWGDYEFSGAPLFGALDASAKFGMFK